MIAEPILRASTSLPKAFAELFQPARYKGFYGGRGAAKSHSFAKALVLAGAQKPLRILCCREIQKSIRDSVKRLLDDQIEICGLDRFYASTDTEIRGLNGTLFLFAGLRTNPDTVRSLEGIDICWVEEANTVSQSSLDILKPTIRKDGSEIWFSWNPRHATDPVDAMLRKEAPPGAVVRQVNWDANPWFPDVLRAEMEWDRARDPEKYAHIWLGEYVRNSEARVFRNWRIDVAEIPPEARPYFGADWGFSIDPTVLVKCWLWGRTLYIEREAYALNCEIDYIPALFAGSDRHDPPRWENPHRWEGIPGAADWPITADSARPETISYVAKRGLRVNPARKGQGSLEDGIEFLKNYEIIVHPDCKHAIDELTLYSYETDKLTGEVLPKLADKDNHVIDGLRYATEGVRRAMVFADSSDEPTISVEPRKIPDTWARVCSLWVSPHRVSAVWIAYHRSTDVAYVYDEYVVPRRDLAIHTMAIKKRGSWIPVMLDHLAEGRKQPEGHRLSLQLVDHGLDVFTHHIEETEGIEATAERLATSTLLVFDTCRTWFAEFRRYGRDEKGEVAEHGDQLMKATTLAMVAGLDVAITENQASSDAEGYQPEDYDGGRSSHTGY